MQLRPVIRSHLVASPGERLKTSRMPGISVETKDPWISRTVKSIILGHRKPDYFVVIIINAKSCCCMTSDNLRSTNCQQRPDISILDLVEPCVTRAARRNRPVGWWLSAFAIVDSQVTGLRSRRATWPNKDITTLKQNVTDEWRYQMLPAVADIFHMKCIKYLHIRWQKRPRFWSITDIIKTW